MKKMRVKYIAPRYIITVLVLFVKVAVTTAILAALVAHFHFLMYAVIAVQLAVLIGICVSDNNPDFKVPWVFLVGVLPGLGFILYAFFSKRRLDRRFIKRLNAIKSTAYTLDDSEAFDELKKRDIRMTSQALLLKKLSGAHLFNDTRVQYFPEGEECFKSLIRDLEGAQKFIFMEFFIVEDGDLFESIIGILRKKAAAGVDVKFLYDDIGCALSIPAGYVKQLRKISIQAAIFSKIRPNTDSECQNRDHRKIIVIDGKIGYTGGINLGDEYANKMIKHGYWKDSGVRLEGRAVNEFIKLFMDDYCMNIRTIDFDISSYYSAQHEIFPESGFIVPFGDGPDPLYERRVAKSIIQAMIGSATESFYITTPYLIVDNDLLSSLENASLRGVDVKIIMPHIPDKRLVFSMSRTYYSRLMKAGVEIYEYEKGFMHSKSYLADGKTAMTGTINFDYRSLVHHFEDGVWMYGCDCIGDLKRDIEETLPKCIKIEEYMLKTNIFYRMFRAIVKVFSPLL